MRKYNPDVFELEEKYQEKNPDWYRQYVDEDADAEEESTEEEASPVMSAKDADDGREYIPWDNTPVMPSRKGFYDDYSCYFNEYRKIPQDRRRDYAFTFVDKERTYYAVMPGDVSPVDGKVVTEEDIAWLHRARDREVYRNNKEKHQESDDYDLLEAVEEEKAKMEKGLPNRYEELKSKLEAYSLVINTGAIVDENGKDCTDHMMAFMGAPSVETQLGLNDNPLADAFEEAEALMEDGICTSSGGEKWYPSTVASILENEKYAGDLLMQKWYVEDYLTHKCVKNTGDRPQYFVEDDHDPIVPKAVFYQVQGEKKRRSGLAKDPSKLRFGNRLALNGRLICGKCGRTLKRYVKPDDALTDWRCRQRALVKKTDFHEDVPTRCDCRIVRETEAQRAVVMAFNTLPSRREELVVQRERLLTGEIGRIDALLKTLDGQQDRLEERLEVLASQVPEDGETINTTVVDEVGSTQVITSEMDEAAFLRSQIVEIRRRKDGLYAERAEHANTEVQIRLLLELVDEMVKNSLPEWMAREAEAVEETGACRDYDDFFSRTRYTVPEGVLDENGRMERFNNDLVIRYLDRVAVQEEEYKVVFKAGITVEIMV